MGIDNVTSNPSQDHYDKWLLEQPEDGSNQDAAQVHPMDSPEAMDTYRKLMEWFTQEQERQAANRYQMALDQDFYDGLQWADDDANRLMERGQAPLVFNQIKPTVDWLLGTETRTRIDYKVLPREEADEGGSDAKTKLFKYNEDVNKSTFARSAAFADATKAGVGWLEAGVRGDPTEEPVFDRYESWRFILYDSNAVQRDLSDARYIFRWKWVDLDVSKAYFPDRTNALESAAVGAQQLLDEQSEEFWYLGSRAEQEDSRTVLGRRTYIDHVAFLNNRRQRVKLIECWYREPAKQTVMVGHPSFHGQEFDPNNQQMVNATQAGVVSLYDRIAMTVRCAVMTEGNLLQEAKSPYRHNRFPFTPVWGYRRARDNAPYGAVRQIRDPQEDMNKRVSKSLHILNTKQVIMEKGAVDDVDELREEVAAPDGIIIKNKGKDLEIQRDDTELQEQIGFMERDAAMIREVGGVTSENLGRDTNANSGRAILAKQDQGGVVTAELFDNLRFAIQHHGEIKLSLMEQFYDQPKVLRILGERGNAKFMQINQPDGQGGVLNDITSRTADFVVADQDYRQSLRMAMFEQLSDMIARMPPQIGMQLLDMAVEASDLPNKEEMAKRIRGISGQPDPEGKMTPQEQAAQANAAAMQKAQSDATMAELQAKIADLNARVEKSNADAILSRLEAMANAMTAAQAVVMTPSIAPVADELLKSSGFVDLGGAPGLVPGAQQAAIPPAPAPAASAMNPAPPSMPAPMPQDQQPAAPDAMQQPQQPQQPQYPTQGDPNAP